MSDNIYGVCIGGSLHGKQVPVESKTLTVCNEKEETLTGVMKIPEGDTYVLRHITNKRQERIFFWVLKDIDLAGYLLKALEEKIEREKEHEK